VALAGDALVHGAIAGLGSGPGLLVLYSSARYLFAGVASAISAVVSCVIPVAYAALTQPTSVREDAGSASQRSSSAGPAGVRRWMPRSGLTCCGWRSESIRPSRESRSSIWYKWPMFRPPHWSPTACSKLLFSS